MDFIGKINTYHCYKILVKGILHTMGPLKFLSIFKNKSDLLLLLIDFALLYQGTGPDWEVGGRLEGWEEDWGTQVALGIPEI